MNIVSSLSLVGSQLTYIIIHCKGKVLVQRTSKIGKHCIHSGTCPSFLIVCKVDRFLVRTSSGTGMQSTHPHTNTDTQAHISTTTLIRGPLSDSHESKTIHHSNTPYLFNESITLSSEYENWSAFVRQIYSIPIASMIDVPSLIGTTNRSTSSCRRKWGGVFCVSLVLLVPTFRRISIYQIISEPIKIHLQNLKINKADEKQDIELKLDVAMRTIWYKWKSTKRVQKRKEKETNRFSEVECIQRSVRCRCRPASMLRIPFDFEWFSGDKNSKSTPTTNCNPGKCGICIAYTFLFSTKTICLCVSVAGICCYNKRTNDCGSNGCVVRCPIYSDPIPMDDDSSS